MNEDRLLIKLMQSQVTRKSMNEDRLLIKLMQDQESSCKVVLELL